MEKRKFPPKKVLNFYKACFPSNGSALFLCSKSFKKIRILRKKILSGGLTNILSYAILINKNFCSHCANIHIDKKQTYERNGIMTRKELKGKKFLHRLLKIQLQIDEKKDELSYWVRQAASCEEGSALSDDIDRRTEELRALIMTMNAQKMSATKLIDGLSDPVGRAILRRRYILCDTWPNIAEACGRMSERNAHYIHDQALLDFERIYCGYEAVFI